MNQIKFQIYVLLGFIITFCLSAISKNYLLFNNNFLINEKVHSLILYISYYALPSLLVFYTILFSSNRTRFDSQLELKQIDGNKFTIILVLTNMLISILFSLYIYISINILNIYKLPYFGNIQIFGYNITKINYFIIILLFSFCLLFKNGFKALTYLYRAIFIFNFGNICLLNYLIFNNLLETNSNINTINTYGLTSISIYFILILLGSIWYEMTKFDNLGKWSCVEPFKIFKLSNLPLLYIFCVSIILMNILI